MCIADDGHNAAIFLALRKAQRMPLTSQGPTSRIFFSQRLRLHYADWGNPDAPPLLLLIVTVAQSAVAVPAALALLPKNSLKLSS